MFFKALQIFYLDFVPLKAEYWEEKKCKVWELNTSVAAALQELNNN